MSNSIKLASVEGLAAGQTGTLRCQIGQTYLQIWLEYTGVTLAQITQLRVLANAKQIAIFSAVELDKMNQYNDRLAASGGRLCIDFTRKNLRSRAQEELTGLATGSEVTNGLPFIENLTVQMDIAAGATAPAIIATAIVDPPKAPGIISKYSRYNFSFPAIGDNEIDQLPKGDAIYRIAFFNSNFTELVVQRNQFRQFQRSRALNKQIQQDGYKRTPTDDIYMLDTGEEGFGTEAILTRTPTPAGQPLGALVPDLRFFLKTTAVNQNIVVITQTLGYLES